jgi:hypothetical protein
MAKASRDPTPAKISDKDRAKIVKLFGLIGSSNPNESESARNKIIEILGKYRLSWVDLPQLLQDSNAISDVADGGVDPLTETEAAPVQDVNVLRLVEHIIWKYVELTEHQSLASALWGLHTHVFTRFEHTPRLVLSSPTIRCGKTTLIKLLERLLPPCHRSDGPSVAAIYWMIDQHPGSPILLDEVDNSVLWKRD